MRILVSKLLGDASVMIYNKQGDLIHTEGFHGKTDSSYERTIPVSIVEFGSSRALFNNKFEYMVVV